MSTIAHKPRANPEHTIQVRIHRFLKARLPPEILWTASMSGVKMTPLVRMKAKAAGLKRGFPDLQFLFPDGVTRYIEVKAPGGVLTPEQRDFCSACAPHNIFTVCRSVVEVEAALIGWGVALHPDPFSAATYEA